MYYKTYTILLGANEKLCDFSLDGFTLKRININEINYNDFFWSYYGKQFSDKMFPISGSINSGKYYISLEHISNKNEETTINYEYYLDKPEFKSFPYKNKKPCIEVIDYINKIKLFSGTNIYPTHIITLKYNDDGTTEIEFVYEFKMPSIRMINQTLEFITSQEKYEEFIEKASIIELPTKQHSPATLAFELYNDSLYQNDIKMEYLMLIIALEVLFGNESSTYTSIPFNYSKFVSFSEQQRKTIEKRISLLYWIRNQLMHKGKWDTTYQLTNVAELRDFVRTGIVKYLEEIYETMNHSEFLEMLLES